MSTDIQQVGIDIGGSYHVASIQDQGKRRELKLDNQPAGFFKLIKQLRPDRCRVVMEATGVYYLDLALALVDAGISVMVVNPKQSHHFAKALGLQSANDRISARMLAEFSARMPFQAWTPPPALWLAFRSIARQINRLTKQQTAAKNRLHALQSFQRTPLILLNDEQQGIALIEQRIERLTQAAQTLIDEDPELARLYQQVISAKGIARASAIAILGELIVLPRTLNAKQCAKHAGLDVKFKQSGTSVESKPRLSKAGNAYLRSALYMPVLVATQHDPVTKARYEALKARGKTPKQAIGALMRKYLTGLWAVVKNNEPFDSQKLFFNGNEA